MCAREGGANTISFLAAHFAKRNTKFGGGKKLESESEGGQKFLPPNPLPFCPPERLDFKIRNSDFLQKKFEHQSKNTAFARRSELRRTKSAIVGREGEISPPSKCFSEGGVRSPCTTSTFSSVRMANLIRVVPTISKRE